MAPRTRSTHIIVSNAEYERLTESTRNFAMRRASEREQIYPVFRDLFKKESQ